MSVVGRRIPIPGHYRETLNRAPDDGDAYALWEFVPDDTGSGILLGVAGPLRGATKLTARGVVVDPHWSSRVRYSERLVAWASRVVWQELAVVEGEATTREL